MFVANRLGEIGELSKVTEWHWVPTGLNPADDATRPSDLPMRSDDRWLIGPKFLLESHNSWPKENTLKNTEKRAINELEARKEYIGAAFLKQPEMWMIPTRVRLLGWQRVMRPIMRVRQIFNIWRRYRRPPGESNTLSKPSALEHQQREKMILKRLKVMESPENVADAEKFWYREIQAACFWRELESLRKGDSPKGSKLFGLEPYIDNEGLLRARGRVTKLEKTKGVKSEFDVEEFENRPIILDADHYATKLLILEFHRRYKHANNETVLNELRQQFYIIGLRSRLRWLAKRCVTCRMRKAKPSNPPMADLPACRVAYQQRPFTHCGIDCFGPMTIKIGRRHEKRWGVLFTCMTTRAVHVELASTLNASSTIMAIQRLASRRGFPTDMYSDNGTNFVKADKELKEAIANIDKNKRRQFAARNRFNWHFNPPDAPHMGGAWERLVRSIKIGLRHALEGQVATEEVLHTILIEVEHMINSRPLTHVSVDPRDEEALTPNHFLIGCSSGHLRMPKYDKVVENPRKTFEIAQNLANGFWKRWLREYIPTLLPRTKWCTPAEPLKLNDIVLVVDFQSQRNEWKKGRVIELFPNKSDNVIRIVKIEIPTIVNTKGDLFDSSGDGEINTIEVDLNIVADSNDRTALGSLSLRAIDLPGNSFFSSPCRSPKTARRGRETKSGPIGGRAKERARENRRGRQWRVGLNQNKSPRQMALR
ncbi:uncharacterized protein LOC124410954 [Diprion similis]|uniref:uncharacterized protein LOC124410954 n=1 Tax=Diprion similis TaxID=362088 RepID=UPI001EF7E72E|nr:uncharacterized protein LOC124410954 [Diprion similis]